MASRVLRSRQQSTEQGKPPIRARWTNGLTKIFADLMVEEVQKGNRTSKNFFTKNSWNFMCDEFYQKTGLKWDVERLKNRYSIMKKQHAILKSLLGRSEFRLDESSGIINASGDAWNEFLKEHPDAEPIRISGCSYYKQLGAIFFDPVTNGKHNLSAEQVPLTPFVNSFRTIKEEESPPLLLSKEPMDSFAEEESCSGSDDRDDISEYQERREPAKRATLEPTKPNVTSVMHNAANHKRGRKGIDDAIARGILQMAAASRLRTAAITKVSERYSVADCIKELNTIQDLEEGVYFAALDLFDNQNAREIFLSLKGDKRIIWLHRKCAQNPES